MIINNTNISWPLIGPFGEVLLKVRSQESIIVRSRLQTINDRHIVPARKMEGGFIKIMKNKRNELVEKFRDCPMTFLILFKLLDYLDYETNILIKNGKPFRISDLAKEFGVTRQSASAHIHKLLQLNVLAELKTNRCKFLVVNPNYYLEGKKIPLEIMKLFEK